MANLVQQIEADIIKSLREKNQLRTDVLRMLKSSLKMEEISHRTQGASNELNDEEALKILRREVKKRKESIVSFTAGQRMDLAEKEEAELTILNQYLPAEISEEILTSKIKEIIDKNQLSAADYGQAMKTIMAEVKGLADGQKIAIVVKSLLK